MPKASAKNGQVCDAPARVTRSSPTATTASIAIETMRIVRRGIPVGEVAGGEREQRQRQEHREADDPEVEWVAMDRVHLPPDRDERHLDREGGRDRRADVEREVPVLER